MDNPYLREYVLIPTDQIEFNNYNPNEMTELAMQLLEKSIKRNGFIFPILVKRHTTEQNKYVIVDGAHRFIVAKNIGFADVPAYVQDKLDEQEAKVETIAMNKIRGEQDSIKLAEVIVDLRKTMSDAELQEKLGYTVGELDEFKEFLEFDLDKVREDEDAHASDILANVKDDVTLENEFAVHVDLYTLDMIETALATINPDKATALFELCQTHLRINHPAKIDDVEARKDGYTQATIDAASGKVD